MIVAPHRPERWRGVAPSDLTRSEFDDHHAVYHRPSGKTHFLNPSAGTLLSLIAGRAFDVDSIARTLLEVYPELAELPEAGGDVEAGSSAALLRHVAGLLGRFEELGLAQREPG